MIASSFFDCLEPEFWELPAQCFCRQDVLVPESVRLAPADRLLHLAGCSAVDADQFFDMAIPANPVRFLGLWVVRLHEREEQHPEPSLLWGAV